MVTRRDVFLKLRETQKLPTPSKTCVEIMRLCTLETTSLNDIAQVVETDPALSAELLKYANAAFLSTGIQVATVRKATVKLGMRTVVNLTLGFSLMSRHQKGKCKGFDYQKFWSEALFHAIAAKTIARSGTEFDPEELFICGLLCHMGELALATLFPEEYTEIIAGNPVGPTRKDAEKEQFGIDSSELTVELFLDWGLPASYALAAGFHDDLEYAELGTGKTLMIAELLDLCQQICGVCATSRPPAEQLLAVEGSAGRFGIAEPEFPEVFDEICNRWYESGKSFKIRTRKCPSYSDIRP